jgi:hypothetical protein
VYLFYLFAPLNPIDLKKNKMGLLVYLYEITLVPFWLLKMVFFGGFFVFLLFWVPSEFTVLPLLAFT